MLLSKLRPPLVAQLALVAGVALLAGCATSANEGASQTAAAARLGPPERTEADAGEDVLEEWKKVYSVEIIDARSEWTHRGYVRRRFRLDDEEGIRHVYTEHLEPVGFVLPNGKAFRTRQDEHNQLVSQEEAYEGIDRGVMTLLGFRGRIEYTDLDASVPETSVPATAERS